MKPPDPAAESLLREWVEKADADLEKYLKGLLTYYQVEFPRTHQIQRLLILVSTVNREAADALAGAKWLGPFGVEIRYSGDTVEMLLGDEEKIPAFQAADCLAEGGSSRFKRER